MKEFRNFILKCSYIFYILKIFWQLIQQITTFKSYCLRATKKINSCQESLVGQQSNPRALDRDFDTITTTPVSHKSTQGHKLWTKCPNLVLEF